ncbi:hypothetical protein C8R45DRAFT_1095847 [Mycena sanguinolenta]|nr:hypothetical protein C8R45DRAFT_1095847 [Mycena sanguinolenta]
MSPQARIPLPRRPFPISTARRQQRAYALSPAHAQVQVAEVYRCVRCPFLVLPTGHASPPTATHPPQRARLRAHRRPRHPPPPDRAHLCFRAHVHSSAVDVLSACPMIQAPEAAAAFPSSSAASANVHETDPETVKPGESSFQWGCAVRSNDLGSRIWWDAGVDVDTDTGGEDEEDDHGKIDEEGCWEGKRVALPDKRCGSDLEGPGEAKTP